VEDTANSINTKKGILLSRNHPVSLVIGAAGFIGSHLIEQLLKIGVQVIGVDSLETGRRENLEEAFKHKSFHFISSSVSDPELK
jgi:nucleoside-diphosphate-sugar epimerase